MVDRRWRALQRALINVPTQDAPRLLDVGCGSGADLQRIGDFWANRKPVLYGIDMLPQRIHLARVALPEAKLVVGSADKLPFPEKFFDVVLVSTLFSSILNRNLAESIARELMRVARPGGTVIVYDVRLPNLTNPNTRSVSQRSLRRLFPNTSLSTESLTLLPPLARRLGSRAPKLYGPMERVPFLRSHNLALIRIGCPEVGSLAESIQ
jgi:ubiquinone/menaquinone biosynthesis C-methylase UbiE